jgi:ribose transport system substrate-binding protein
MDCLGFDQIDKKGESKSMKKILVLALALVLFTFVLAACGNGNGNGEEAVVQYDASGNRIVRVVSHNAVIEGNPYRIRYEADLVDAAAAALDHGLNVSIRTAVSDWDASLEATQIRHSIDAGYDVLVVNPVTSTGMDPLIHSALEAGVTWVFADIQYTTPDIGILNVITDQYYLGLRTAQEAGRVLGPGARVVLIEAMPGVQANEDRQRGFWTGIEEYGLEVVHEGHHDWAPGPSQTVMTEIINSGIEFDGVLISQLAENALAAFDATGTPYPRFMGFNDTGAWMQRMIEINQDGLVMNYIVLSNPPGVGASALNFALNMLLGREMRTDMYDDVPTRTILLPSKFEFTNDTITQEYIDIAMAMAPGDAITYWYTIDEIASMFFH